LQFFFLPPDFSFGSGSSMLSFSSIVYGLWRYFLNAKFLLLCS
jgi:hypothetical protein